MLGIKRREVKCLEVGSYAVSLHDQTRAADGLDLKVKPAQINAAALFRALAIFGRRLREIRTSPLIDRAIRSRFRDCTS